MFFVPIFMKKSRPAYNLHLICKLEDRAKFEDLVLYHTTSIGLRVSIKERKTLDRKIQKFQNEKYKFEYKISSTNSFQKIKIEHDDISRLASKHGKSIAEMRKILLDELKKQNS